MEICNHSLCTGCGMCLNLCPHYAINMKKDKYGFLYPNIDSEKCAGCELCRSKCPANNTFDEQTEKVVYAAWNKKKSLRRNSTSGGIFSALSEGIINNEGIVIGCAWDKGYATHHICVERSTDLYRLRGSKYVQSNIGYVYASAKKYLQSGKEVLFSGTPCQIHALRSYLGKDYDKLLTIDVICHGVPPYDMFKRYIDEVTDGNVHNIKSIHLRYKKPCWSFGSVRIEFGNKKLYKIPTVVDAYFNLFNFKYSLRESCHYCKYANLKRVSDITLGDFWGYEPKNFKMRNYDAGVSCVLLNTKKGTHYFNSISKKLVLDEERLENVVRSNKSLSKPSDAPGDCQKFWQDYLNGISISELNRKYIKSPYKIPKMLWLRRKKRQYKWIFGRIIK